MTCEFFMAMVFESMSPPGSGSQTFSVPHWLDHESIFSGSKISAYNETKGESDLILAL